MNVTPTTVAVVIVTGLVLGFAFEFVVAWRKRTLARRLVEQTAWLERATRRLEAESSELSAMIRAAEILNR